MGRNATLCACIAGALVAASGGLDAAADVTRAQRLEAIRHARVWAPTAVEKMDITAGPAGPQAFRPGETVSCDFVPHSHGSGHTQKFACRMRGGRELKVRYWPANGEVYAHVAASRLLWALGFPAYPMYPVKVICHGCDGDPFRQRRRLPAPSRSSSIRPRSKRSCRARPSRPNRMKDGPGASSTRSTKPPAARRAASAMRCGCWRC